MIIDTLIFHILTFDIFSLFDSINWQALNSILTACGLIFIGWELKVAQQSAQDTQKIAQAEFEDSIDVQYRQLAKEIPVDILFGLPIPEENYKEIRELIYNYLDLSNEQVYLRKINRVSKERWIGWREGIKEHLQKEGFKQVWEEVKQNIPHTFRYLEMLEKNNFQSGPRKWLK